MRFFAGYVSTSPSSAACFEETIRLAIVRGRAKYLRGGELQERTVWAGPHALRQRRRGTRYAKNPLPIHLLVCSVRATMCQS